MKQLYLLAICALCACAQTVKPERNVASVSDSPLFKEAMDCYEYEPEKALSLLDSAQIAGHMTPFRADFLRARVYTYTLVNTDHQKALEICLRLLDCLDEEEHDSAYMELLDMAVQNYRALGDDLNTLRWSTDKANYCREIGEETEALRTDAEIGVILTNLGLREEGLAKLDYAIRQLDTPRKFARMDACIIAIKRKVVILTKMEDADEVLSLAQKIIGKVDDYLAHPDDYDDGSFRMPKGEEARLDYCNFYRTQAHAYMAWAYAIRGNEREARHYAGLYENSDMGRSTTGQRTISPTWLLLGEYDKLLPFYDNLEKQLGKDTLNTYYAEILKGRALAAQDKGRYKDSNSYWERYSSLSDKLNQEMHENEAHVYAAQYRLQEQEIALQKKEAEATRKTLLTWSAIIIAVLAVFFVLFLLRKNQVIDQKNGALSRKIVELINLKDEPAKKEPPLSRSKAFSNLSDEETFHMLESIILSEQLYLNPSLDRQQLMDRFHLSKERIGAAFSQGSSYHSLIDFLMEHRLAYGARLLLESPELSVQEVALRSGFASGNIFGRNFKQRFALTPSEFRRQQSNPSQEAVNAQ